jgi:DNA-binding GntR family transcriptional regulator
MAHNLSFGSRPNACNLAKHQGIADAIVAQDAPRPRKEMVAHIRASIEATTRWAEHGPPLLSGG